MMRKRLGFEPNILKSLKSLITSEIAGKSTSNRAPTRVVPFSLAFSGRINAGAFLSATEILGLPVTNKNDIGLLSAMAMKKARAAIEKIKACDVGDSQTGPQLPSRKVPVGSGPRILDLIDDVSNELCKVADWAECVRNVHSDDNIARAAEQVSDTLLMFVEELNSDKDLYLLLKKYVDSNKGLLDGEAVAAARSLLTDFENGGINLGNKLGGFLKIKEDTLLLSREFLRGCDEPKKENTTPDAQVDQQQYETLDKLIKLRRDSCKIMYYPSFSHMALANTMARTPVDVGRFLSRVTEGVMPGAKTLLAQLDDNYNTKWSMVEMIKHRERLAEKADKKSPLIPLPSVMSVLSDTVKSLFSAEVLVHASNQRWLANAMVVETSLVCTKTGQQLGTMYLDLFPRDGKVPFNCHYTLSGRKTTGVTEQCPSVYVVLNIPLHEGKEGSHTSVLTDLEGVSSVFHEAGHALHSLFFGGRYQHLSGTRCSTDVAEIPSTLFEIIGSSPPSVARMLTPGLRGTGADACPGASAGDVSSAISTRDAAKPLDTFITGLDSLIDLNLHGQDAPGGSLLVIERVLANYSIVRAEDAPLRYQRFSHFIHYPSKYYSYLWAEGCARLIWDRLFERNPCNGDAGREFRKKFLEKGGTVHGSQMMRDLVGEEVSVEMVADAVVSYCNSCSVVL